MMPRIRHPHDLIRRLRRQIAAIDFSMYAPLEADFRPIARAAFDQQRILDEAVSLWRAELVEGMDDEWIYEEICTGDFGCGKPWKWLPWEDYTDDHGNRRSGWNRGYCGATCAYILGKAVGLRYDIRRSLLPSPSRLMDRDRCAKVGFSLSKRVVDPLRDLKPCDVVCVDTYGDQRADHLAMVWAGPGQADPLAGDTSVRHREDRLSVHEYRTIEGNAKGYLPDGRHVVGVVTNIRSVYEVRGAVRFVADDCEQPTGETR